MSSTVAMALVTVSLAPGTVMVTMTVETSLMSKAVVSFSEYGCLKIPLLFH